MSWIDTFKSLKSSEHRWAWLVAMAADAIQIIGFPILWKGRFRRRIPRLI